VKPVDPCDMCLLKNLRFQAGSPYYDGPDLASQSLYQSRTSSCGIQGQPLTATSALDFYTSVNLSAVWSVAADKYYSPTSTSVPTPTSCSGKEYTIQAGDDCYSISSSQGIGTAWLLANNDLLAYCADFSTSGKLCLQDTCDTYTVKHNETCDAIADAHNVTIAQLRSWNPVISAGCYNLNRLNGSQICITSPGKPYTPPSGAISLPLITPTAAVPVPGDAANGTNDECARYYKAVSGDYCNLIIIKFGISLEDFRFLNSATNENCTNLYADESYCVQAVGDINTYSGRAGYATATSVPVSEFTPYSDLPSATATVNFTQATGKPLDNGTRDDCNYYFDGSVFQGTLSWYSSQCARAAAAFNVDLDAFGSWNQGMNASDPSCSFQEGVRYCGKLYFGDQVEQADESQLPIRDGASVNCTDYTDVWKGRSCQNVLDTFGLTITQFYVLNPAVEKDCSGLWTGYSYCVATADIQGGDSNDSSSETATSSSGTTVTSKGAPGPTQSGIISNCNSYLKANAGGSCTAFASRAGISLEQLYKWNSVLGSNGENCASKFWGDEYYCVGVSASSSSMSSTTKTSASSKSTSSGAPGPTQTGIISTCNKYLMANPGGSCTAFASSAGVSLQQLYAWNTVLGSKGENCASQFWGNEYYCVGVSSSSNAVSSTHATTSKSTSIQSAGAPGPTQSGIISTCSKYLMANPGGSCAAFASRAGISLQQLYAWNSVLGSDGEYCASQFWGNEYYCVDVASKTTVTVPGPTQTGITSNCNKFGKANPGGSCSAFAARFGITTEQLYSWNAVLGVNGENCAANFWGDEYYCVGVGA
jgi:LysM repeat protein